MAKKEDRSTAYLNSSTLSLTGSATYIIPPFHSASWRLFDTVQRLILELKKRSNLCSAARCPVDLFVCLSVSVFRIHRTGWSSRAGTAALPPAPPSPACPQDAPGGAGRADTGEHQLIKLNTFSKVTQPSEKVFNYLTNVLFIGNCR